MTQLVIFDLDGTLLNTISDLGMACNHALTKAGYAIHPIDEYPRLVGNGVNKLIERALPEDARNEAEVQRLRTYFVPYYDAHNCEYTQPYEGIAALLKALRERGVKCAVASNKYQAATEKLVTHYFPHTFDWVLGERQGIPRKPHPQIVHDILASSPVIGLDEVLYVGDSDVDMQTAHAAGVRSVACTWGFCTAETLAAEQPTHTVHHPLEILDLL